MSKKKVERLAREGLQGNTAHTKEPHKARCSKYINMMVLTYFAPQGMSTESQREAVEKSLVQKHRLKLDRTKNSRIDDIQHSKKSFYSQPPASLVNVAAIVDLNLRVTWSRARTAGNILTEFQKHRHNLMYKLQFFF